MEQDYSPAAAMLVANTLTLLRPHRVMGARKLRIGRHFDGGYNMIDRFDGVEAAYSLGINDDTSWDFDIAQRGVKLFQYDHTISELPNNHPLFNWKKIGIAGAPDRDRNLDSLESVLSTNSHTGNQNLILKCDIEGAEWDMLSKTPTAVLRQFSQIVVELHDLQRVKEAQFGEVMRSALGNLNANHRCIHVHANNYGGVSIVGGYPCPHVLEATFVRLDFGDFTLSAETFPTPYDMPCNRDAADIYLGRFEFV